MDKLIKKIYSDELSKYIVSYRSVRISISGCRLQSKQSNLIFDLSSFIKINKCQLHMSKLSGNGVVLIQNDNKNIIYTRSEQIIDVKLIKNKIHIARPSYSTGEVEITGITLYFEKMTNNFEGQMLSQNWKQIISKCGEYKGLRLIRGKLFAAGNAFIINSNNTIKTITTKPPNLAFTQDNKIKFKTACCITNIELSNNLETSIKKKELFQHREGPTPHAIQQTVIQSQETPMIMESNISIVQNLIEQSGESTIKNNIIYDSQATRGFDIVKTIKNNLVKYIRSNNEDFILIKSGGTCAIPISTLKPNTRYICILSIKKFNGNGKLFVSLSTEEQYQTEKIIATANIKNQYVSLPTGPAPSYGEFYKLLLSMPKGTSTGDILIGRAIILEDINISVENTIEEIHEYNSTINMELNIDTYYTNSIFDLSKTFAQYPDQLEPQQTFDDIGGLITYTTLSGKRWLKKIKPFFPLLSENHNANTKNKLLIGSAGYLKETKKIWIDHFYKLSENDKVILKNTDIIFTPSNKNKEFLETFCENSLVILTHKPLPYVKPLKRQLPIKNFVLMFDKDKICTKRIIESWDKKFPTLILVGARGKWPNYVLPMNEYFSYNHLLQLFLDAKCFIDISSADYISSFTHLAAYTGIPIISNKTIIKNYPNTIYTENNDVINGIDIPTQQSISKNIQKAINKQNTPLLTHTYNNELEKTMRTLLSL